MRIVHYHGQTLWHRLHFELIWGFSHQSVQYLMLNTGQKVIPSFRFVL